VAASRGSRCHRAGNGHQRAAEVAGVPGGGDGAAADGGLDHDGAAGQRGVLRGSFGCRVTLRRAPNGELLQHTSMGVVLVVAASLRPAVQGAGPLVQHLWRDYRMLINR